MVVKKKLFNYITVFLLLTFVVSVVTFQFRTVNANAMTASIMNQSKYAVDEIIIKYKDNIDVSAVAGKKGGKLAKKNEKLRLAKIKIPKGKSVSESIEEYMALPEIEYAEPNYSFDIQETPNDTNYSLQWGLTRINANQAWDTAPSGSSDVMIAVIDTGIDADHPDLAASLVQGYNSIDGSTNTNDDNGHGTHVAGIAAGIKNNNIGIAGVASGSKVMPVKAMGSTGSGYTSDIAEGITWAVDHYKALGASKLVINMSLGAPGASTAIQDAVNYAYNNGVIVIAAMGNSNTSTPSYPAACDHVIAVAATNNDAANTRASFSNYGSQTDIAAPGVSIFSTTYDGAYGYKQGTSMAAPFVAGAAALVWSQRPDLTESMLEGVLLQSATDIGTVGKDIYFGNGLVNVQSAMTKQVDSSPINLTLLGDTPDPFGVTGTTTCKINYSIGSNAYMTIEIFNSSNQKVRTLLNAVLKTSGTQYVTWNGKDDTGAKVPNGTYTYKVTASNAFGVSSTPLTDTIVVDSTAPTVSGMSLSSTIFQPSGSNTVTLTYSLSENAKATIGVYTATGALIKTLESSVLKNLGTNTITWDGKGATGTIVADGSYKFTINTIDTVGLAGIAASSPNFIVDSRDPVISAVTVGAARFKPTGTSTDAIKYTLSESSKVTLKIYSSAGTVVRTLINGITGNAGAASVLWNGKNDAGAIVPDGTYTFKIDAADLINKNAVQQTGTIIVDTTAPVVSGLSLSTTPFLPDGIKTVTFSYTLSENAKVTIGIYTATGALVKNLENAVVKNSGSYTVNWDGKGTTTALVAEGKYKFVINSVDLTGISGTPVSTTEFIVDSRTPVISAVTVGAGRFKPTGTNTDAIKYTLSESSTVTLKIYNPAGTLVRTLINTVTGNAGAASALWNGKNDAGAIVPDGTYTFKIDAVDLMNKNAVQQTGTIIVDTTAPVVSGLSLSSSPFLPDGIKTVALSYTLSENAKVTIGVYTATGALVKNLESAVIKNSGSNTVSWNGKGATGAVVLSGTYKFKISTIDLTSISGITQEIQILIQ